MASIARINLSELANTVLQETRFQVCFLGLGLTFNQMVYACLSCQPEKIKPGSGQSLADKSQQQKVSTCDPMYM